MSFQVGLVLALTTWSCVSHLFWVAKKLRPWQSVELTAAEGHHWRVINNCCSLVQTTLMILFSHKAKWLWGLALMVQKWFVVLCVCLCQCFCVCCFNEAYSQFSGKVNTIILHRLMLFYPLLHWQPQIHWTWTLSCKYCTGRFWEQPRGVLFQCMLLTLNNSLPWLQSMHFFYAETIFKTPFYILSSHLAIIPEDRWKLLTQALILSSNVHNF